MEFGLNQDAVSSLMETSQKNLKNEDKSEKIEEAEPDKVILSTEQEKAQVNLYHMTFEYQKEVDTPEEVKKEEEQKKDRRGRPEKSKEEKNQKIYISLPQSYLAKFRKIEKPKEFKKYKRFGDSRKAMALIDRLEKLEARERLRISKLQGELKSFHEMIKEYKIHFKNGDNTTYAHHFMKKLERSYRRILLIYDALSFKRDDIRDYLSVKEDSELAFIFRMKMKEDDGERFFN